MKKTLFMLVISVLLISVSACTAGDKSSKKESTPIKVSSKNNKTTDKQTPAEADMEKADSHAEKDSHEGIEHLTALTFQQKVFNYKTNKKWKYEGSKPCIIDFYADWCQPCKKLAPIMEKLSREYAGEVIFYKVDTQNQKELSSVFGIRSIPSILFVPVDGKPQMAKGLLPERSIKKAIHETLKIKK